LERKVKVKVQGDVWRMNEIYAVLIACIAVLCMVMIYILKRIREIRKAKQEVVTKKTRRKKKGVIDDGVSV
jgi:hypothetical protein